MPRITNLGSVVFQQFAQETLAIIVGILIANVISYYVKQWWNR